MSDDSMGFSKILDDYESQWKGCFCVSNDATAQQPILAQALALAARHPQAQELAWELVLLDMSYRLRTACPRPLAPAYFNLSGFELSEDQKNELRRIETSSPLDLPGATRALPAPKEDSENLLPQIGPYTLKEQVGQGGMGVVWRAKDRLFRRSLAIKVLSAEHRNNADLRRRFVEEAQLMGQLQHPGIPPVHDLGELPDGRPYFAMKLIKGKTLSALLAERARVDQDRPQLLTIFEQICQTLAYVHAQGIIHRDLKPANVMVGAFAEVQVMDWGLAKVVGDAPAFAEVSAGQASTICTVRTEAPDSQTQAGQAMGTPAYMAPEQARGETDQLDERCDVFGLGAILTEILTGRPPFMGRDTQEVLQLAQNGKTDAALVRLQECGADSELLELARSCLAAEKRNRPASADAVAKRMSGYFAAVQKRLDDARVEKAQADARAQLATERLSVEQKARQAEHSRGRLRHWAIVAAVMLGVTALFAVDITVTSGLNVQERWRSEQARRFEIDGKIQQGYEDQREDLRRIREAWKTPNAEAVIGDVVTRAPAPKYTEIRNPWSEVLPGFGTSILVLMWQLGTYVTLAMMVCALIWLLVASIALSDRLEEFVRYGGRASLWGALAGALLLGVLSFAWLLALDKLNYSEWFRHRIVVEVGCSLGVVLGSIGGAMVGIFVKAVQILVHRAENRVPRRWPFLIIASIGAIIVACGLCVAAAGVAAATNSQLPGLIWWTVLAVPLLGVIGVALGIFMAARAPAGVGNRPFGSN